MNSLFLSLEFLSFDFQLYFLFIVMVPYKKCVGMNPPESCFLKDKKLKASSKKLRVARGIGGYRRTPFNCTSRLEGNVLTHVSSDSRRKKCARVKESSNQGKEHSSPCVLNGNVNVPCH